MSHDADKLIRQLSLVAFLMAERRALTARDIKSCVEGYSEMSDEAFARRFYSDRSELLALGIPLQSQRDEFTGEELYTLRSEQYFLPPLELSDEELAALQTSLFLLEGQFAYAEPLRLALQNLALGRPRRGGGSRPRRAVEVNVQGKDYSPEMPGWLTKLDAAISKQRTVRFRYRSIGRDEVSDRTINPYALFCDNGVWYVVGLDLERDAIRTFRVSRIRATSRSRRAASATSARRPDFDPSELPRAAALADRRARRARRESPSPPTRPGGSSARSAAAARDVEDGVFVTEYADVRQLASWVLRQDGRARPLDPPELVGGGRRRASSGSRGRTRALRPRPRSRSRPWRRPPAPERPAGRVPPERFAVLQALLAHLLARCGDGKRAVIPAAELVEGLPDSRTSSSTTTCSSSTSSTSAAAATRSTRSSTATRCASRRSCSATPSGGRRG